jgi:hypothetical protein
MKWSDIPFHPTQRVLRQFAAAWLIFGLSAAVLQGMVRGQQSLGVALAILAVLVGGAGLIQPATVRWIFAGLMVITFPIGWVVTQIVLAILFYGIFTPVALIFRLQGRDLLGRKARTGESTYWQAKRTPQDVSSYFRQF